MPSRYTNWQNTLGDSNLVFALRCAGCGGAVGGVEIQEMCIAKTSIRGYNDFGKFFLVRVLKRRCSVQ